MPGCFLFSFFFPDEVTWQVMLDRKFVAFSHCPPLQGDRRKKANPKFCILDAVATPAAFSGYGRMLTGDSFNTVAVSDRVVIALYLANKYASRNVLGMRCVFFSLSG